MTRTIAVSGASGKTGLRVVEEVAASGDRVRLLLRPDSRLPERWSGSDQHRFDLSDRQALDRALTGVDALVIATGARPSIDLTGPMRVDAWGVQRQVESCRRMGAERVVLVSSLCAGRWRHPLNLFGLILIWKRLGEQHLERSGLDWTVIRPGGLSEREEGVNAEGIRWSGPDEQMQDSIPRRLVARCCIEALQVPESIGRILEVTSSADMPPQSMAEALATDTASVD